MECKAIPAPEWLSLCCLRPRHPSDTSKAWSEAFPKMLLFFSKMSPPRLVFNQCKLYHNHYKLQSHFHSTNLAFCLFVLCVLPIYCIFISTMLYFFQVFIHQIVQFLCKKRVSFRNLPETDPFLYTLLIVTA